MKLFDFKVSDKHNLPEDKIKSLADESASDEADLRGWAPGYQVRQLGEPVKGGDGATIYQFEVVGALVPDDGGEGDDKTAATKPAKKPSVAASPAER